MRSNLIARNSLWIALDTGLSMVVGVVISVLVARVLGPEKMGFYAFIGWVANMTGMLVTFGPASTARKFAAEYIGRGDIATARKIVESTLRWQMFSALVTVFVGGAVVFTGAEQSHRLFYLLAVLSLFPVMLRGVLANAIAATQEYWANVWPSLVAELVNLLGTLLTLKMGWGLVGLTGSLLACRSVDLPIRYYLYRACFRDLESVKAPAAGPVQIPEEVRKRLVRFSWHTTLLMILDTVIWDRSEVFFLKYFSDITQVTFYSLSFGIVEQILLLPRVFASASGANIMVEQGRAPDNVGRVVSEVLRYMALIAFPMTIGLAALSFPAIHTLYGQKYLPTVQVLVIAALFSVPRAFLVPAQQLLMATENQVFLVYWGIVTGVLNVSLDLWWIPRGGALGAAWANGVAQAIAMAGIWIFVLRRLKIELPILDLTKLFASAAAMGVLAWAIGRSLPPFLDALLGVAGGAAAYLVLLRLTRSLHGEDRQRLIGVQKQLPGPLRPAYVDLVRLVVP